LEVAFNVVTANGAKALGITDYGLEVGVPANFVVVKATHIPEAIVAVPKLRTVYRRGKCIVRDGVLQK
jgi:cytosine deaminase